jgi:hypothetical protein
VGDKGRLVVPLDSSFAALKPFILDISEELPKTPDLVIIRIEFERRGANPRLLIDFIPYAPGILSFPVLDFLFPDLKLSDDPLEIMPTSETMFSPETVLPKLSVQVASILTPSQMTLSEPASPLAVPGTSLLIFGTTALILLILSLGIVCSLWGRRHFREFWERLRRRRLLRGMTKFLRRLKQECGLAKEKNPGHFLTLLSVEARDFLSFFTGFNCRPLTAREFLDLPLNNMALDPACLCRLFRGWDNLRFSGQAVGMADVFRALDEMESLIAVLDKAEREKLFTIPFQDMKQALIQVESFPTAGEGL